MKRGRPIKDISGKRVGMLTVTQSHRTIPLHGVEWLCVCDCGKEDWFVAAALQDNAVTSCGCIYERVDAGKLFDKSLCEELSKMDYASSATMSTLGKSPHDVFGDWPLKEESSINPGFSVNTRNEHKTAWGMRGMDAIIRAGNFLMDGWTIQDVARECAFTVKKVRKIYYALNKELAHRGMLQLRYRTIPRKTEEKLHEQFWNKRPVRGNPERRRLSPDQIREIRKMLSHAVPMTQIAKQFNMSPFSIANIRDRATYNDVP